MNDNSEICLSGWLVNTPVGYCLWFRDGSGILLYNWQVNDALMDRAVRVTGWWVRERFRAELIEFDVTSSLRECPQPLQLGDGCVPKPASVQSR